MNNNNNNNTHHLPQEESTYLSLQTFQTVEEMNEAIKTYKETYELSATDRNILDVISRYSCKYIGVTYLSKPNIANEAGYKSRRTVIRSCNRLEEMGIIKQYETRRVKGDRRRSSNVIVIQPIENTDDIEEVKDYSHAEVTADSHDIKASSKAINSSNTYKDTVIRRDNSNDPSTSEIIKRGLRHAIPTAIYDALEPFFNGQGLYDTYGILLRSKAKIDRSITLESYADRYINAFYNVIRLYKSGKVRRLNGLLYATWERLTAEISRQITADKKPLFNPYG